MKKTFKFIDLFAGIGGLRIPFDDIGGKCVFTSEWDKFSQQTYEAYFKEKPQGDITTIDPKNIPSHDLILAGFPCQPFSHAGHRLGLEDTRGTLFFHVAKIIEYHRPKVVLLENVKGLLHHDGGNTYQVIRKVIEDDLGYTLHTKLLNAKDFGVPQSRQRLYMIAVRDDADFSFPEPTLDKTRLGDILESSPDPKYTISDLLWSSHQRRKLDHIAKGNGFGYSMFDNESPYTRTLSARYYKDGSEILVKQEKGNPRMLTPLEACRLQGFPENFPVGVVSDLQTWKQFGNSVAVPVVRQIASKIKPILIADTSRQSIARSSRGLQQATPIFAHYMAKYSA